MPLDTFHAGTPTVDVSGSSIPLVPVHVLPDMSASSYVTVRLSNGDAFYTAGGTSVSGGGVLTADQGSPNTLGNAWPIKVTDGSSVLGTRTAPLQSLIVSGGVGVGVSQVSATGALRVDVVQSVQSAVPSGSLFGLLVGGDPLSTGNPVPITATGAGVNTTSQSGSITGILVGGQAASQANPLPVQVIGAGSSTTSQSGSVTGLLVGGLALSNANPAPISDAGGSITVDGTVSVSGTPTVSVVSGSITALQAGGVMVSSANPLPIGDGGGSITVDGTVSANATLASGSVTGLLVGGVPVSVANPLPIGDGGGALTVDGTVNANSTVLSGSVTGLLVGGQSLSNANPVPISDAGGTITVDGSVNVANSPSVTALSGSVFGQMVGGQPVSNANPVPISDAGGTITVDGTLNTNATVLSGSVAGLLVGGLALSNGNPVPISDAGGTITVDGTITVGNSSLDVLAKSGSQAAIMVGGLPVANANPVPISDGGGSITVDGAVTATLASTVINSGSVTGLLVGGLPVANPNPVPISDAGTSLTVDGTVSANQGTPAGLGSPWPVQIVSGSDVVGTTTNPIWVTGSVYTLNPGGAGSNVTSLSGSVTGLLVGGVALSSANPMWVTGSVALLNPGSAASNVTAVSGSVTGLIVGGLNVSNANPVPMSDAGGSLTVDGTVTAAQGSPAGLNAPWPVILVSGSDPVGTTTHPVWVTGSVLVLNPGGAGTNVTSLSGSVTGLLVGGVDLSNSNPFPVSDAGGSITVDGTVSATVLSGSVAGILVGGLNVSNGNPFPVSDAGASLTVDGTVTVVQGTPTGLSSPWPVILVSGSDPVGTQTHPTWVTGSVYVLNPGGAGTNVTTQSGSVTGHLVGGVALSNANPFPISDAGGSITVDGGVTAAQGTPAALGAPWPVILVSGSDPVGTSTNPTWVTGSVYVLNPGGAGTNVTAVSGSVTGLLVGGLSLSNANPAPISDAGGSITVDGTVGATQGAAAGLGAPWPVILVSGSDPVGTITHPTWVTGSVAIVNQSATVSTLQSGSITGLLVGGLALSNANPVPISDAGGSITVDGSVNATALSGSVFGQLVGGVPVSTANPVPGMVQSGSLVGHLVGGLALSNANPFPVSDAGGSLTVDGAVTTLSGSVAGILVGGLNVSSANPVPTSVQSGSVTGLLVGGQPTRDANPVPSYAYDGTGQLFQSGTSRAINYAYVDTAASGSTAVVGAQGGGVKIRVLAVHVMAAGAVSVRFISATTNKTAFYPLAANGGFVLPFNPHGWFETNANEALNIGLGAAVVVAATITWIQAS